MSIHVGGGITATAEQGRGSSGRAAVPRAPPGVSLRGALLLRWPFEFHQFRPPNPPARAHNIKDKVPVCGFVQFARVRTENESAREKASGSHRNVTLGAAAGTLSSKPIHLSFYALPGPSRPLSACSPSSASLSTAGSPFTITHLQRLLPGPNPSSCHPPNCSDLLFADCHSSSVLIVLHHQRQGQLEPRSSAIRSQRRHVFISTLQRRCGSRRIPSRLRRGTALHRSR